MPTEDELRRQFQQPEQQGPSIDLDAVLRRSRARRRPRVVAAALVSSLAVLAIVVPVSVSVAQGRTGFFGAAGSGSAASRADDAGQKSPEYVTGSGASDGPLVSGLAPAEKVNLCTGALADVAPAANGLVITVAPVTAPATDRDIPTTVTLTNTGSSTVRGSLSPYPALTFSRDGVVLWHSNGPVPQIAQELELAPGASLTFSATFEPVVCAVADDERADFRSDLPAAGPGDYRISALVQVTDASGGAVLVGGPTAAVTLR